MHHIRTRTVALVYAVTMILSPARAETVTALAGATAVPIPIVAGRDDSGTAGPIAFGDGITYRSTSGNSLFGYTGGYGFSPTLRWDGTPMIGLNAGRGTLTLVFDRPVAGFLADTASTQYATAADAVITAFDAAGNLLDRIVLERDGYKVQPGYLGFRYADARIGRITFANEYIALRNISVLTPRDAAAIPEPAAWGMMILGVGAVGVAGRRTHRLRGAKAAA